MQTFSDIKSCVEINLNEFNEYYVDALKCDKNIIQEAVDYILKTQGKQIRPLLLLLSCGMHGEITDKAYITSSVIEMTHLASLIHDDVVDEAYRRRSMWSFNALWRSRKAVLIGDYIFSKAINTATENTMYFLVKDIANAINDMSIGEILQSEATLTLNITKEEYYDIIKCKTATLIASCLYCGAYSGGASQEECDKIRAIGLEIGYLFQIKDDILDYQEVNASGKNSCNDIKERKITLPLICALESSTPKERKKIISIIRDIDGESDSVEHVLNFVINKKGIEQAVEVMESKLEAVKKRLAEYPESIYRDSMISLSEYICKRDK